MARTMLLLALGATGGAAAVYLLMTPEFSPDGRAVHAPAAVSEALPAPRPRDEPAAAPPAVARPVGSTPDTPGLALIEAVAAISDPGDIETGIIELANLPRSRSRDAQLRVLLLRLAEFDAGHAARFAWAQSLEVRFIAPLYRYWARMDAEAVLAELERISPATEVRDLALAVLDVFGNDAHGVARVAAALPEADRPGFEIEAMAARARQDPTAALMDLLAVQGSPARSFGGARVAAAAVRVDPLRAITDAALIDNDASRTSYLGAVIRNWTEVDPDGVFNWLQSLTGDADSAQDPVRVLLQGQGLLASLISQVADSDPERLLAMVDQLPVSVRAQALRGGLQALASTDPLQALARIDQLPVGQDRNNTLQTLARAYARQDPSAALAWARSLSPPSELALRGVINGIAAVNIDQAIDIVELELANQSSGAGQNLASAVTSGLLSRVVLSNVDSAEVVRVANRLMQIDDPRMRSSMMSMTTMWASRDPEAALDWMSGHAEQLEPQLFSLVGQSMAQNDLDAALHALATLPPGPARENLLQGVASGIASHSVDRAVEFLDARRDQPGTDAAWSAVVMRAAQNDPVAAAGLLDRVGTSTQMMQTAPLIANSWARQDPLRAAQWARSLGDEQARSAATAGVAVAWAAQDADAAAQWIRTLPTGAARDRALAGYLSASTTGRSLDTSVLPAFSSDIARQEAVSRAIVQIGQRDPREAQQLMEQWITDPVIRRQTEQSLARSGGIAIGTGNVVTILP